MNFYIDNLPEQSTGLIEIIALLVSIFSILITVIGIYISKQIDIKYERFGNLCLANITNILHNVDEIFKNQSSSAIHSHRKAILDSLVELNLFLSSLRKIYPKLDVELITTISDKFSDEIHSRNDVVLTFNSTYYETKVSIYDSLYKYAINKELNLFGRLVFRLK